MRTDKFVYLSGPITPRDGFTVEQNVASAAKVYIEFLRHGLPAFCPHLGGAFPSAHSDVGYEAWMAYDFAVIDRCTDVVMLPRWQTSSGAIREAEYARGRGIPVHSAWEDFVVLHGHPARRQAPVMDLRGHLERQIEFSERTFGPGPRTAGVVDHIRKELSEIESAPEDLSEWIDVVILAFDGAWRAGHTPEQIVDALLAKQAKNEARRWPDWRTAELGKAIEHVREGVA